MQIIINYKRAFFRIRNNYLHTVRNSLRGQSIEGLFAGNLAPSWEKFPAGNFFDPYFTFLPSLARQSKLGVKN